MANDLHLRIIFGRMGT